ncbi:helix-turn-helix domain-containing protein [Pediococcus pentosaceus]|nr:helix-turn-helix domain-containing protein [Pediococcus pentosaceus]
MSCEIFLSRQRNSRQSRKENEFGFDNVRESNWPKSGGVYKGRPILFGPDVKNQARRKTYFEIVEMLNAGQKVTSISQKTGTSRTLIYRIKNEI